MYLEHFGLKDMPFLLTPNTRYFCNLPAHQNALNVIQFALRSGESLIKVTGEVGSGKTLLCRKILNALDENVVVAYIPNPDLDPIGLRVSIAREFGLEISPQLSEHRVLEMITEYLIELRHNGKHGVLLIDEAQALPDASLEALRLITNIETESQKLLQIVLFGQPELDTRLNSYSFRQLKQRITFSYRLEPISRTQLDAYIIHRLMIAGHTQGGNLFSDKACRMLYKASAGIPRIINILSHKALLVAYGRGEPQVSHHSMQAAINDSDFLSYEGGPKTERGGTLTIGLCLAMLALFLVYFYFNQIT